MGSEENGSPFLPTERYRDVLLSRALLSDSALNLGEKMAVFQTPVKLYPNVTKGFKKQNKIRRLKISVILLVQAEKTLGTDVFLF